MISFDFDDWVFDTYHEISLSPLAFISVCINRKKINFLSKEERLSRRRKDSVLTRTNGQTKREREREREKNALEL